MFPKAAQAQAKTQDQNRPIDRGSFIIGGNAGINSSNYSFNDEERDTSIFLNPSIQYFVLPGPAIGGRISLSYSSYSNQSSTSIGIGPAISYYFDGMGPFYPFVSAGFSYAYSRFVEDNDYDDYFGPQNFTLTRTAYSYDVASGATLMVAKNIGITGAIFYYKVHSSANYDDVFFEGANSDANTYGLRFGVRVFIY